MLINSSFDTVTKALDVTVDGKAVANILGISISLGYRDDDQYYCELSTGTKDADNDCWQMTRLTASNTPAGRSLASTGLPESTVYVGWIPTSDQTKTQKDIAAFFASK